MADSNEEGEDFLNYDDEDLDTTSLLNEDELLLSENEDDPTKDEEDTCIDEKPARTVEEPENNVKKSPIRQEDEESHSTSNEQNDISPTVADKVSNDESRNADEPRQDRPQRRMRNFEPGPSGNSNFRPSFHPRGGPYRQNNFFRPNHPIPPRFQQMKPFFGPSGPAPNFFGFRPNRFFKPVDLHAPRMLNPMAPPFIPRQPLITSNTANFQPASVPQKVLINPNFKGGVEAVKSQIMKSQMFSAPQFVSEEELLRKQEEFINQNVRQIQKRRNDRSPSPRRHHRSRSRSHSPQRYPRKYPRHDNRRPGTNNNGSNYSKQQPEEDEETRAYREKIEAQRRKREELLRQKEIRRKQQQADKAKQEQSEQLKPIVVTDKKIVLKKLKADERSTTPPLKEHPTNVANPPPARRIVLLKSSKDS